MVQLSFCTKLQCISIQGTISGVSQYIKGSEKYGCKPLKPEMKSIAVEPQEQMLITDALGGEKIGDQGPHKIQGMGAGLVPKVRLQLSHLVC